MGREVRVFIAARVRLVPGSYGFIRASVSERAAHHAREEASRVVVVVCTRAAVGWNLDARQKKDARQHLLHAAGQTQFSLFEGTTHACNIL